MWTAAQRRAFEKGLAECQRCKAAIDKLKEIAKHAPAFADRVEELATRRDYGEQLATVALSGDDDPK